jgi:hypothetical protein
MMLGSIGSGIQVSSMTFTNPDGTTGTMYYGPNETPIAAPLPAVAVEPSIYHALNPDAVAVTPQVAAAGLSTPMLIAIAAAVAFMLFGSR